MMLWRLAAAGPLESTPPGWAIVSCTPQHGPTRRGRSPCRPPSSADRLGAHPLAWSTPRGPPQPRRPGHRHRTHDSLESGAGVVRGVRRLSGILTRLVVSLSTSTNSDCALWRAVLSAEELYNSHRVRRARRSLTAHVTRSGAFSLATPKQLCLGVPRCRSWRQAQA